MFTDNTHTLVYWCIFIIYAFYYIRARARNHLNPLSVTHKNTPSLSHTKTHTHTPTTIPLASFMRPTPFCKSFS